MSHRRKCCCDNEEHENPGECDVCMPGIPSRIGLTISGVGNTCGGLNNARVNRDYELDRWSLCGWGDFSVGEPSVFGYSGSDFAGIGCDEGLATALHNVVSVGIGYLSDDIGTIWVEISDFLQYDSGSFVYFEAPWEVGRDCENFSITLPLIYWENSHIASYACGYGDTTGGPRPPGLPCEQWNDPGDNLLKWGDWSGATVTIYTLGGT